MVEENSEEEIVLERIGNDEDNLNDQEWLTKAGSRIDPILQHLDAGETPIDKTKIRDQFIKIWDLENGEKLEEDECFLTTVGLFIYTSHLELDEHNLKVDEARGYIISALEEWMKPETEKMLAAEKDHANPFVKFVEGQFEKVEHFYTWRHFLLDHKKTNDKEWTYKMKQCWFSRFFIRYGRTDMTLTACQFDQIPAEARKDYVKLKLTNQFPKWGSTCTFQYTPTQG
tara:strand:+ start:303 stop:986 length:684 start_codon:yes stop_codon:yes gene_type:complete